MNYGEKALANHKKAYNCSQAVACAFCKELGVEEQTAFRMMEGFGGGMGDKGCVCGAVSGAAAVLGMKNSDGCLDAPATKRQTYALVVALKKAFEDRYGSVVCKDLKRETPEDTSRPGCDEYMVAAAEIAGELLERLEQGTFFEE